MADTTRIVKKAAEALGIPLDAGIAGILILGTNVYELQAFETEFQQDIDHKTQPQSDIKGGLLLCTLKCKTDAFLQHWIFDKNGIDGEIHLAPETRRAVITVRIKFTKGRCVSFQKTIGPDVGIYMRILISPETLTINDIDFTNLSMAEAKRRSNNGN